MFQNAEEKVIACTYSCAARSLWSRATVVAKGQDNYSPTNLKKGYILCTQFNYEIFMQILVQ